MNEEEKKEKFLLVMSQGLTAMASINFEKYLYYYLLTKAF